MFPKYLTELIGTFIFLSVILTTGEAIPIGIALMAAIFFGAKISGGHFNPAVSFMMYLKDSLSQEDLIFYMISQFIGGALALYYFNEFGTVSLDKK